jgi:TP901 family phage tail tape measure protein
MAGKKDSYVRVIISGVDKISSVLSTASARIGRFGKGMANVGKNISTHISLPLLIAGGFMLRAAGNFESAMLDLKKATGASTEQFNTLRESAKKIGETTEFSATTAAKAMVDLAKGGFNVNEVLTNTPKILELIAATQTTAEIATNAVTSTLKNFNMTALETGRVTNALAVVSTQTRIPVEGLAESYKEAGLLGSDMGIEFEEMAAVTGLLGRAGFGGAEGMASFRKNLVILNDAFSGTAKSKATIEALNKFGVNPDNIFNKGGKIKSIGALIGEFNRVGIKAQDVMQIFGKKTGLGFVELLKAGVPEIDKMVKSIKDLSQVTKLADAREKTFNEKLEKMKARLESVAITFADSGILEGATKWADVLLKGVSAINKIDPASIKTLTGVGLALIALGPAVSMIGNISKALTLLQLHPVIAALTALVALLTWVYNDAQKNKIDPNYTEIKPGQFNVYKEKQGIAAGSGALTGTAAGGGALTGMLNREEYKFTEKGKVNVTVDVKNALQGTKVKATSEGVDLSRVSLGFAGYMEP